jgi:hypothetical protein
VEIAGGVIILIGFQRSFLGKVWMTTNTNSSCMVQSHALRIPLLDKEQSKAGSRR